MHNSYLTYGAGGAGGFKWLQIIKLEICYDPASHHLHFYAKHLSADEAILVKIHLIFQIYISEFSFCFSKIFILRVSPRMTAPKRCYN